MNILVTGGRGYIGSHACKLLARAGHKVVCVDDESRGHAIIEKWAKCFKVSTLDTGAVSSLLRAEKIEAVFHFAAYAYVGESVENPYLYYHNNVAGTLSLLTAMREAQITRLIFSSTCASYGDKHGNIALTEDLAQEPINAYGRSKLYCEGIIRDACHAYGLSAVVFRYFNASGADAEGEIGEDHEPETHLVPLAIRAALEPGRKLVINGSDFPTKDGTAIRDYIHVEDIAAAHVQGIDYSIKNPGFHAFNLGNNRGYSILEVLEATERICGSRVESVFGPRRPGDPPMLVGDNQKAKAQLNWHPRYGSLEDILETAVAWEKRRK